MHDVGGRACLRHVTVQFQGQAERLVRQHAVAWVDREPVDLFRGLGRHFFDVDAAGGAHHQHGALRGTVHDDAHVAFGDDLGGRCDEHALHHEPLDRHAEDLGGVRRGLGRVAGQLDAARLAAAPGVHLRLDDHRPAAAQPGGDGAGLLGRGGHLPRRDRNAVAPEDLARLVLVQVHAGSVVMVVPASPASAARPCDSSAMIARRPPARTKSAAASTLGRMLPVPSSVPASK